MRHIRQSELQEAKTRLRELDDLKLFGPDHLTILSARRAFRQKISELERRVAPADRQQKSSPGKR